MTDKTIYFGTRERMKWVKAPAINANLNTVGRAASVTFLNGGGGVDRSALGHAEYEFNWKIASNAEIHAITDYYSGVFGKPPFYFVDPFAMNTNLLPPYWAAPGLFEAGGPSLRRGVEPDLYTVPPDAGYGPVTRTNLATNPRATTGGLIAGEARWNARWYGSGGGAGTTTTVTGATDAPEGISTHMRKTWSAAGGVSDTGFDHTTPNYSVATLGTTGLPVTAGVTYTFSSYMRASTVPSGTTFAMRAAFRDATGARILPLPTATSVTPTAGQWVRVSLTATAPAGATTVTLGSDVSGAGTWPVGATLDGTGLLVEQSPDLGPYFDGSTPAISTHVYGWTGAANASTSTERVVVEGSLPVRGARYALSAAAPSERFHLPVPPGYTAHFGWFGRVLSGTSIIKVNGSTVAPNGAGVSFTTTATGSLTLTTSGTGTVEIDAMHIRMAPTGSPAPTGPWVPGQGHSGVDFAEIPSIVGISAYHDKQSTSVRLIEVGAWL